MFTVELYAKVRHAVMIEGLSRGKRRSDLGFTAIRSRRC